MKTADQPSRAAVATSPEKYAVPDAVDKLQRSGGGSSVIQPFRLSPSPQELGDPCGQRAVWAR